MHLARPAAAFAVGATAMLALAGASHLRLPFHAGETALLRIAFSARPERIETCRTPSEEELAAVAAHMRQQVVCDGASATYRLTILRNADTLLSDVVRGGGLRRDRQLYVLRELVVPSGSASVEVHLMRIESATRHDTTAVAPPAGADTAGRTAVARRRRQEDEMPPVLALREQVSLTPREVMLVTYDRSTRRLRAVRAEP